MKVSVARKLRIHLLQIPKQGEEVPDEQVSDADKVCLDTAGGAIDPEQRGGPPGSLQGQSCLEGHSWIHNADQLLKTSHISPKPNLQGQVLLFLQRF